MLAWFLLIMIFWKPIYFMIMSIVKKDSSYLTQTASWFKDLLGLVNPIGTSY